MTQMMIDEAKKFNTTVESLREQGFVFLSEACGDCHWFYPEPAFGGTLMSLAWYRQQQAEASARIKAMRGKKAA